MAKIANGPTPSDFEVKLTPSSAIATISSMLCEVEIIRGERPPGLIQAFKIGDMKLLHSTGQEGRLTTARSDRLIRRSNTDDFLLGMVIDGNFSICHEGRQASLLPGELVLIDSHRKYELEVSGALDLFVLKIARKSVETHIMEYGRYLGVSLDTQRGLGFVVKNMLSACITTAPYISTYEGRRFEIGLMDLVGAAFRYQVDGESDSNRNRAYKVFNRLRQFIEEHLSDPELGPAMISREFSLSERYIRKMFAAHGTTLMSWIKDRRLQRCHQAISRGDGEYVSFAEIAYAYGFSEISSFNRAFKAKFGVTPSEVKQATLARSPRLWN